MEDLHSLCCVKLVLDGGSRASGQDGEVNMCPVTAKL